MVRKVLTAIVAVAVACAVMVLPAVPASGATIEVQNSDDAGAGSFRQAVIDAAPGDTITFAAGLGPIALLSAVVIDKDLTITGNGVDQTILEDGDGEAVLWINDGGDDADVAVTITDLTVRDAVNDNIAIDGFEGGTVAVVLERLRITGADDDGIDMASDDTTMQLTVRDSVISGNGDDGIDVVHSTPGVGTSTTTVEDSTISGNEDQGVTTTAATTDISDSTVSDQVTDDGLHYSEGATGTVARTTISGNGDDAVRVVDDSSVTIVNSTLSGNVESGVDVDDQASVTVLNSTIVDNAQTGVELDTAEASATITNTIVYDNPLGDCSGDVASGGGNIDGDGTCDLAAEGDQPETDPLLGALAANGGPTDTHLPLEGSPAIDAALAGPCPDDDQRGESRPQDGDGDGTAVCDVGAVEVVPDPVEETPPTTAPPEIPVAPTPAGPTPVAAPAAAQPTFTG